MPDLNNKGPGGLGPKTGKKLGKCRKTEDEKNKIKENYSFKKETMRNFKNAKNNSDNLINRK